MSFGIFVVFVPSFRCRSALTAFGVAGDGSTFAAMALGFRYGYGIGLRVSCPESAAMYEKAAQSAVSGLDRMRRKTVEQSNPNDADHLQLLSKAMPPKQHMDVGMVEYMDYDEGVRVFALGASTPSPTILRQKRGTFIGGRFSRLKTAVFLGRRVHASTFLML